MAWTDSRIFMAWIEDVFEGTYIVDLGAAGQYATLYNNNITPDLNAAAANTIYNAGVWSDVNEVYHADGFAGGFYLGGNELLSPTSAFSAGVYTYDAADVSSDGPATMADIYGCFVYTPAYGRGICYHYFGGSNSVTDGNCSIVWAPSGIFTITA